MVGGIEGNGENEVISSNLDEQKIADRIAALEIQSDSRGPIINEENNDRAEDARDLLRLIRDSGNIDMDEIHEIEDKFGVSWNEIKEELTSVSSRNDSGLELADSEIGLMVQDLTSLPIEEWGNERYTSIMNDIKAISFNRGGYYQIGSFFSEGEIIEGDIHFYPNTSDGLYGAEPIRIAPDTSLSDIGTQLLQRLVEGGTFATGGNGDNDLITQIEETYGVDWNTVKEMS